MKLVRSKSLRWFWLGLLSAVIGLGAAGCSTTESDNMSSKPWNSPEGWQNGSIPTGMMQPH